MLREGGGERCFKPTGCDTPNISQYIEYISFGVIYTIILIMAFRLLFSRFWKSVSLTTTNGQYVFILIILLSISKSKILIQ